MRVIYDVAKDLTTTVGVDFGSPQVDLVAFTEHDMKLVLKIGSGSCWAGIGLPRTYVPAHYSLYQVVEVRRPTPTTVEFRVDGINAVLEWNVKREKPVMLPRSWGEVEKVGDNPDTEDGRWPTFTEQQAQTAAMMAARAETPTEPGTLSGWNKIING